MTDYGLNTGFSFHRLSQAYPTPMPAHAQNAAGPSLSAPPASPSPMSYMPVQGPSYLSGGYFLAAPQMFPMGAGGYAQMGSAATAAAPGVTSGQAEVTGHVTANSTNAMTSAAGGGAYLSAGGMPASAMMPGAAGFGMAGMMAMPVGFVTLQPMVFGPVMMPMLFGFVMPVGAGTNPDTAIAPDQSAPQAPPAVAVPEPEVPVVAAPETPGPAAEKQALSLPIAEMSAADFKRFRFSELNAELTTSLSLSLTTAEGDKVTLEFNQADLVERMRFSGKSLDGERHKVAHLEESTNRVVNMEVDGDISAEERAAIESVLSAVVEVANRFFNDDMASALNKLNELDFNNPTLADLSLKMSMTHSVEHARAFGRGAEHDLARLKENDASVARVLDFFTSEQKQLIEAASEVLDRPSAVRMVKSLLPAMLEELRLEAPFAELADKLADTGSGSGSEPAPDQTMPVVSTAEA